MPALAKLTLPKSFSLIKQGAPRVIEEEGGKRYVEELDATGKSFSNPCFVAGDGETVHGLALEIQASSAQRSESPPARANPDDRVSIQLLNVRSENAELRSQVERSTSEIAQLRLDLQASRSAVAGYVNQIAELQAENTRLSALPDGKEFSRLMGALQSSERNVERMEQLMGVSGISSESVVVARVAPPTGDIYQQYKKLRSDEASGEAAHGSSLAFYRLHKGELRHYASTTKQER